MKNFNFKFDVKFQKELREFMRVHASLCAEERREKPEEVQWLAKTNQNISFFEFKIIKKL